MIAGPHTWTSGIDLKQGHGHARTLILNYYNHIRNYYPHTACWTRTLDGLRATRAVVGIGALVEGCDALVFS